MNSRPRKNSRYQSPLRAQQAAATRQVVLDAATVLFLERGYVATSVDAIAEAAGVGRSTVFASGGSKPGLLKNAYDRAVVGDDEPVPLLQRPEARELFQLTDPAEIVAKYAEIIAAVEGRVSAIYDVVRVAAGADPDIKTLWEEIQAQRLTGAHQFASLLRANGCLRPDMTIERARDVVWIYNDPSIHHALVSGRGWDERDFVDWLTNSLSYQVLLGWPAALSPSRGAAEV